jgi:arsenate reductase
VIDYQKTPLTLEQLSALHRQLHITVREMVRDSEEDYAALKLETADDTTLLQALAAHPKLLQRPIVAYRNRAVIGRPLERVNALLDGTLA